MQSLRSNHSIENGDLNSILGSDSNLNSELVSKEIARRAEKLRGARIFRELCHTIDYQKEGVCHITKNKSMLSNWYIYESKQPFLWEISS